MLCHIEQASTVCSGSADLAVLGIFACWLQPATRQEESARQHPKLLGHSGLLGHLTCFHHEAARGKEYPVTKGKVNRLKEGWGVMDESKA